MINPGASTAIDPIHSLISRHASLPVSYPIPLVSTHYDIRIDGGFAVVETRRVFRNEEARSIEATLTFPLPVQAALFSLYAEHDGRTLTAIARKRAAAREVYEGAVEEGKTAVLHEELLRGIHMLSVAHIAPGAEISITARWAITLTRVGEHWQLRIPLTVGHVYGQSPLSDADAIETGGASGLADVVVRCTSGQLRLLGTSLDGGRAQVPLDAPIDIEVSGAAHSALTGITHDGRLVALEVTPLPEGRDSLELAILVDRSGSMDEACNAGLSPGTKHQAVIQGLTALAGRLRKGDTIDLWEFNNSLGHVGSTRDERPHWRIQRHDWSPGAAFESLARSLREPSGGTEIGNALAGVLSRSQVRDVLLITDGKSYALDVQELARSGRRIAVVLVGEDSLEANVGHLAAVTGGSVFVARESDIAATVATAADTLRSCELEVSPIEGPPERIEVVRGGAVVRAQWREAGGDTPFDVIGVGIAAYAAGLAIARMDEPAAAEYAERAGIASHLTSLVLVDEAAEVLESVPAMRKVRLPSPRVEARSRALYALSSDFAERNAWIPQRVADHLAPPPLDCSTVVRVDWDVAPAQLLAGDLSSLDVALAQRLREIAELPDVVRWATELKLDPIVLVIAALAYGDRHRNRTAERIARKVFGDTPPVWIDDLSNAIAQHAGGLMWGGS